MRDMTIPKDIYFFRETVNKVSSKSFKMESTRQQSSYN